MSKDIFDTPAPAEHPQGPKRSFSVDDLVKHPKFKIMFKEEINGQYLSISKSFNELVDKAVSESHGKIKAHTIKPRRILLDEMKSRGFISGDIDITNKMVSLLEPITVDIDKWLLEWSHIMKRDSNQPLRIREYINNTVGRVLDNTVKAIIEEEKALDEQAAMIANSEKIVNSVKAGKSVRAKLKKSKPESESESQD